MWYGERRNQINSMKWVKKTVFAIVIVLITIQFIQPAHNKSGQVLPTDITKTYSVPENVAAIFKNACYDCHSNNTRYPWYSNIQPMAWMMAMHIKNGKEKLNFSEFGSYTTRRQISKLKGIANSIKDATMPLASYKMIHKNATLSQADKALTMDWIQRTADCISTKR